MEKNDVYFMKLALKEAEKAYKNEEIPIGAVLVDENNKVVSRGYNKKEKTNDITSHAEIVCIKKASKKLNDWRLNNLTLYVTIEPCLMCASAIIQSRIKRVVFGAREINTGGLVSKIEMVKIENSKLEVKEGVLEEKCLEIVQRFFKDRRKKN